MLFGVTYPVKVFVLEKQIVFKGTKLSKKCSECFFKK